MKKWTLLDETLTPDGRKLTLHEHDGTLAIRIDGVELMSTRSHDSEEKLAELACAHLNRVKAAQVLVGGLGFGFTLQSVLANVRPDATVVVAELLPAVIRWSRNNALKDRRVHLVEGDVFELITASPARFDSIVLDVDNGASAFTWAANERLYQHAGLGIIKAALKPRGCAAFWSAKRSDPGFEKELRRAGFRTEAVRHRAHTIFLAFAV